MTGLIKQWSYSTLKTYTQCPLKVKLNKIDKIREPGSNATDRGERIHLEAENYIKLHEAVLPDSLKLYKEQFKKLWKMGDKVVPEQEWAFNEQWQLVKWTDPTAWVRMKIDAHYITGTTMTIIDYKSGKVYDNNRAQLSFYAMAAMTLMPQIKKVVGQLWYLDHGPMQTVEEIFFREELEDMHDAWKWESRALLADVQFAPRPGYYCRFCFYSKDKNGNCEY